MNKLKMFISVPASAMLLTGCTFGSSIDNLMSPPKLSVEQEQIYNALTDATGTSISLKYPKSGKYLSAFIVEDIDGDGGNEAIVFYEKASLAMEENTLRINILDKSDGKWRSVSDTSAKGTEIEKVMISQLGSNDRINIIIGSSLINRTEKNVSVYTYNNGVIEDDFSEPYSFMDITDMDGNGEKEFLLLNGSSGGMPASADTYQLDREGIYHRNSRELSGNFTEFDRISYGSISGGKNAVYIDAISGTGLIQTDILYMDDSGLKKVFSTPEEALVTVRPSGCNSFDVDGDGIPEIPVQEIAPGYEEASESEQMKLTKWLAVNGSGELEEKYTSYYSLNDGYIFLFPEKWDGRVTVKLDPIYGEIVFCVYESGQTGRELLRISRTDNEPEKNDKLSSGYKLLRTKGDSAYLAYIPPADDGVGDDLAVTAGDTAVGFMFS